MGLVDYVGTVAATCTTCAYIPQLVKIRRQGAADLSWLMLLSYLLGLLLWLAYGLLLHAGAVIWANAITSLLVAVAILMKLTGSSPSSPRSSAP
jgi:MtN3 and saliva related transmembrane protein